MNEAENQVNDLEYKEAKDIQSVQQEEKKKNPENLGQCKEPLGQLQAFQYLHHRVARRRRERARNWKLI